MPSDATLITLYNLTSVLSETEPIHDGCVFDRMITGLLGSSQSRADTGSVFTTVS